MNSNAHPAFESIHIQLLFTVFLIVLLWALYQRFRRSAFFHWWAWAWTFSGLFLASAIAAFAAGPQWSPIKIMLLAAVLICGLMQPFLLVLGGLSWHIPDRPLRRMFWAGTFVCIALSALVLALGYLWRSQREVSFAVRNLPRTLTMIVALSYCCYVFFGQWRKKHSWGALISGTFCLFYAFDQLFYSLDFLTVLRNHLAPGSKPVSYPADYVQALLGSSLFFLDLVHICGICLGMILLLVEEHQLTERSLELSELHRHDLASYNSRLQAQIDERVRVEQALRASEERIRQILQDSPVGMLVSRVSDESVEFANGRFYELFGYPIEEVSSVQKWWLKAYPDLAYREAVRAEWNILTQKIADDPAAVQTMTARVCCCDGKYRDIEFHLSRIGDSYFVSFIDMTAHKMAKEALRESEAKFRLVADTAPCGIWILQGDRLAYLNCYAETLTGYSREELLAMNPWDLVDPEFRKLGRERHLARLRGENPPARYQFKIRDKKGEAHWLDFSGAPMLYEGKPAVLATAFDITAAKDAEQQLKERTMYLDSLISNSPLGIVTKDQYNRVLFCNPAFEQMFQYSQDEIRGMDIDELIAAHESFEARRLTQAVRQGGVIHATAQRRRKDGSFLDVELHGIRVFSGNTFVGAFAFYQDISERRRNEEKLLSLRNRLTRAQEEESARIARDLHDDIGQRLALLSIELEQLSQCNQRFDPALAERLSTLVRTAGELTTDVHNTSRRLHPSQVELLGLCSALELFCREFSERNSMQIQYSSPQLNCRPSQDAALCLFRVAQEAIRNVQKHSGCTQACVELDELDGTLRLRVSDRGAGFDPFSSEVSQGLGLLSMEERLRSLGGELFVNSRPGAGTCIEASLPIPQTVSA